jgi:hypothetical protein
MGTSCVRVSVFYLYLTGAETAISVFAHFDGEHILLDQDLKLELNTKLIVTVLPQRDDTREAWMNVSSKMLENTYGLDEIEYSLDLIKEANPEYEP